jgi:pyrimidine operon attenuation protein/uracil phosphoribosyltransferase
MRSPNRSSRETEESNPSAGTRCYRLPVASNCQLVTCRRYVRPASCLWWRLGAVLGYVPIMQYRETSILMDAAQVDQALSRLADEIVERGNSQEPALVGIRTRGVPLARRLAARIKERSGIDVPVGVLDITLYRDDLTDIASQPVVRDTVLPFPVDGRRIVLVDDVLYTGRTVRAAIDQLIDFGRPRKIELMVLVDRGWRELPIQADYVGKEVETAHKQMVDVRLREEDGRDEVVLMEQTS